MKFRFAAFAWVIIFNLLIPATMLLGNGVKIVHVKLAGEAPGSHVNVGFDISWQNSWRNDIAGPGQAAPFNYDAVWVFIKFSQDGGATWRHATLSSLVSDHALSDDHGHPAAIVPVGDGRGVFMQRASNGSGDIAWEGASLRWNYAADGVSGLTPSTIVEVLAIEMVFIPEGAFEAGDSTSLAAFRRGPADPAPWSIDSAGPLQVTSDGSSGYYYQSAGNVDEDPTGAAFTIPAAFPDGFGAFYIMKYEVSQGQYAAFLNRVSAAQAAVRNITAEAGYAAARGTISGDYPFFEAGRPDRACNFLSIMDGLAYADWAGLRPMTELEFEKAGRGTPAAVKGEYAWGDTTIMQAIALSGSEDGTETVATLAANAHFGDATLSGGDGGKGPLRTGIFAAGVTATLPSEQRQQAGASYYGIMELSGNLIERVVTAGNAQGRGFSGSHGDGALTTVAGFEGNANNPDWPGFDIIPPRGSTSAGGSGYRGGSWLTAKPALRLSARANAATYEKRRLQDFGFRCVRTAP